MPGGKEEWGEARRRRTEEKDKTEPWGFPRGRDSLLHAVVDVNVGVYVYVCIGAESQTGM